MSEKKYVGSGKKTQYSSNIQVNLNQLFEQIYNDTQNKNIGKIFADLKKELTAIELPYLAKFKSQDKPQFAIKIAVTNRKEPDKNGNDLKVELNEFVPTKKAAETVDLTKLEEEELDF